MAQFKTLAARVLRSMALSEFTKHLDLEVNGVTRFGFVPGQWLSVKANTPREPNVERTVSTLMVRKASMTERHSNESSTRFMHPRPTSTQS